MSNNFKKHSLRVVGIDKGRMYDILFIRQGSDKSFYWGFCSKKDMGHFSRHKSGNYYMKPNHNLNISQEDKEKFFKWKRLPLQDLKHNEQLLNLLLNVGALKGESIMGAKEYKNKKVDAIFAIDLRKFKDNISIHAYLVPNINNINDILSRDWYKNGEFYIFTKTEPKLLIVAHPS